MHTLKEKHSALYNTWPSLFAFFQNPVTTYGGDPDPYPCNKPKVAGSNNKGWGCIIL